MSMTLFYDSRAFGSFGKKKNLVAKFFSYQIFLSHYNKKREKENTQILTD
jgi:hypothetical protein